MDDQITPRDELAAALEQFAALIERNAKESEFQRLFRENPFILSRTLRLRTEPTDVVPLGRAGRSEPDFVLFPSGANALGVYGVVEIKRPSTLIVLEKRKELISLSRDAATAVDQVKAYSKQMEQPIVNHGQFVLLGSRAHLFIIAGLSRDLARRMSSELLIRQADAHLPPNCQLIPYDTLLEMFHATIPPQVHVLVPDTPVAKLLGKVEFRTLDDWSTLPSNFNAVPSRWKGEAANVLLAVSRAENRYYTVRVAQDITTGDIIGAGAYTRYPTEPPDKPLKDNEVYLSSFAIMESYHGFRIAPDLPVEDALMEDVLVSIRISTLGNMPSVLHLIDALDESMCQLAVRHGFSCTSPIRSDEYDMWNRPQGLIPQHWRSLRESDVA